MQKLDQTSFKIQIRLSFQSDFFLFYEATKLQKICGIKSLKNRCEAPTYLQVYKSKTLGLFVTIQSLIQSIKAKPRQNKKKIPAVANVEQIKKTRSLETGIPSLVPYLVKTPNHSLSILWRKPLIILGSFISLV